MALAARVLGLCEGGVVRKSPKIQVDTRRRGPGRTGWLFALLLSSISSALAAPCSDFGSGFVSTSGSLYLVFRIELEQGEV